MLNLLHIFWLRWLWLIKFIFFLFLFSLIIFFLLLLSFSYILLDFLSSSKTFDRFFPNILSLLISLHTFSLFFSLSTSFYTFSEILFIGFISVFATTSTMKSLFLLAWILKQFYLLSCNHFFKIVFNIWNISINNFNLFLFFHLFFKLLILLNNIFNCPNDLCSCLI